MGVCFGTHLAISCKPCIRTRNPRFYFVHVRIAGTTPRFLTKKSGIPCSGARVCIVVNPSCKYFTYIQKRTNPKKNATHRHVIACVCIFVNPSCKYFTYIQKRTNPKQKQSIAMTLRGRLYFCKPNYEPSSLYFILSVNILAKTHHISVLTLHFLLHIQWVPEC